MEDKNNILKEHIQLLKANLNDTENKQQKTVSTLSNKNLVTNAQEMEPNLNLNITLEPAKETYANAANKKMNKASVANLDIIKKQTTNQTPTNSALKDQMENKLKNIINLECDITHENLDSDKFQVVTSKRRKFQPKFETGTAEITNSTEDSFQSNINEKKLWIFISRVKDTVSEEAVQNYIKDKTQCKDNEISIKCLKSKTKYSKNCFLVGIKPGLSEVVYNSNFWPAGVAYSRFNFRKGQHFLDHPTRQPMLT